MIKEHLRKAQEKADLLSLRKGKKPVAMMTAYDYPTARLLDEAGVDCLLVGDSLGMVVMGYPDTTSVTLADMVHHVSMVARARPKALIIADMPIHTYDTPKQAVETAWTLVKAGGEAVKLEGGKTHLAQIQAILSEGIPVVGHVGLLPQSVLEEGGYRIKGKTEEEAQRLLIDAEVIGGCGVSLMVIEGTSAQVARQMTGLSKIPTIGIGSGSGTCDGAVVVIHDLVGAFPWFVPGFIKPQAQIGRTILDVAQSWINNVQNSSLT